MRVHDEGIGALDPSEPVAHARRGERSEPVGAVDVEPEVALAGHVRDPGEVVDPTGVGGAAGAHDRKDRVGIRVGVERCPHVRAVEAVVVGVHDQSHRVHDPDRALERRVGLVAEHHPPPGRAIGTTGCGGLAPGDQGREVRRGATGHEASAGPGREPGQVRDPAQRLVLGEDGAAALQPRTRVHR